MNFDFLLQAAEQFRKTAEAKVRSRGTCVFPAEHSLVMDNRDHYPINNIGQGRNAIARANQMTSKPEWYKGSLESFVHAIVRHVHSKFPDIEISEKAKHPGKD